MLTSPHKHQRQSLTEQVRQLAVRRARQMARLRARGWTLARIAEKYGMSRQRVHAILRTHTTDVADILTRDEVAA